MNRLAASTFGLCLVAASSTLAANQPGASRPGQRDEDSEHLTRLAAKERLKFLYVMRSATRSCTEASQLRSDPQFLTGYPLDEVEKSLEAAAAAAREVGVDVEQAWSEASWAAEMVGTGLKQDTAKYIDRCQQTGRLFLVNLKRLEHLLRALGSERPPINGIPGSG